MNHYNLVSDPGRHSYKECLVSLLWCWEVQQGMHLPWQYLKPGKMLTPLDCDMDDKHLGSILVPSNISPLQALQDTHVCL